MTLLYIRKCRMMDILQHICTMCVVRYVIAQSLPGQSQGQINQH